MIGISYIDYYLPTEELSISSLLSQIKNESVPNSFKNKEDYEEFVKEELCLNSVRVETQLETYDMIDNVLSKMFESAVVKPEEVKLLLLAQEKGVKEKNNMAQYLQYKFKMKNAFVLNVNGNHCANVQVALNMANSIYSGDNSINKIAIISSSSKKQELIDNRIIGSYGILGDAAGVVLLEQDSYKATMKDSVALNNGIFYKANSDDENFLLNCKYAQKCLEKIAQRNSITDEDISQIIIANSNSLMTEQIINSVGLDIDKIYRGGFGKYGHLDCIDFIVNLSDFLNSNYEKRKHILVYNSGLAGSYVSSLLSV